MVIRMIEYSLCDSLPEIVSKSMRSNLYNKLKIKSGFTGLFYCNNLVSFCYVSCVTNATNNTPTDK